MAQLVHLIKLDTDNEASVADIVKQTGKGKANGPRGVSYCYRNLSNLPVTKYISDKVFGVVPKSVLHKFDKTHRNSLRKFVKVSVLCSSNGHKVNVPSLDDADTLIARETTIIKYIWEGGPRSQHIRTHINTALSFFGTNESKQQFSESNIIREVIKVLTHVKEFIQSAESELTSPSADRQEDINNIENIIDFAKNHFPALHVATT
jgi:hypothetical protein